MRSSGYVVRILERSDGRRPFAEWRDSLRDPDAVAAIRARLNRLRAGLFGDCKSVGDGVFELRVHSGPGYRVYFARHGVDIVVLLGGGTKKSQAADIRTARALWQEFCRETG